MFEPKAWAFFVSQIIKSFDYFEGKKMIYVSHSIFILCPIQNTYLKVYYLFL